MSSGTKPSGVVPWARDERGWCVWGLPVDPLWWCDEAAKDDERQKELQRLADYQPDLDGGPGCLAAIVASATEQLAAWQQTGLTIAGRRWADLGGSSGHYALALHLAGASKVTLLDAEPPSPWAVPVLASAGIDVLVGDAGSTNVPGADAALLLYVGADTLDVLGSNPELRLLITDDVSEDERRVIEGGGWKISTMTFPIGHVAMSDGLAVPGYDQPTRLEELLVCQGDARLVIPPQDDGFEDAEPTQPDLADPTNHERDDEIPL